MNSENTATKDKYIPPHRRYPIAAVSKIEAKNNTLAKRSINHSKKSVQLTHHASLRQAQRDIVPETTMSTLKQGVKLFSKEAVTYVDEQTQVVLGRDNRVITVQRNNRNAKFDLLGTSNARENILLEKVRLENNDYAMCELAEIYLSGDLGNREIKKAYDLLLRAAAKENSHAMCLIAKLYTDGDLGAVDLKEAQRWLEKAAKKNNRYALAIVGQRLLQEYLLLNDTEKKSENSKKLLQKIISYLKRSAAKGGTRAMWQLAKIYEEGWHGEKNLAQAIRQYIEAANLGSPTSMAELQRLVAEKKLAPEAFEVILDKASKLIAKTSSGLAVQIGLAQIKGELGANCQRGFEMLVQAAKKNNKDAILALAKCYRDGIGCTPNPVLSQYWFNQLKLLYEKAIQLGNINALLDLGNLFLNGACGKIDFASAEKLFIQAAQKDDTDSIYYLGTLYIKGQLGDRDPAEGIAWINKAIEKWTQQALSNNTNATENLIDLYLDKQLGFKNYQKAAYWLSVLACKGNNAALQQLMSLYLRKKIKFSNDESDENYSQKILEIVKQKAIEEASTKALWLLACLQQQGYLSDEKNISVNQWAQKLEATLREQAETKAAAALLLGKLYKQKKNLLSKNLQQAAKYLCLAACLNSELYDNTAFVATKKIKKILNNKTYTEIERKQILTGILECADQLGQKAPYKIGRILGDIYYKSSLVEPNHQEAAKWYELAASLGNSKAMYRLGIMHQNKAEIEEAIKLFELAAKQENRKAIAVLVKLGKRRANPTTNKINDDLSSSKNPEIMYMLGKQAILQQVVSTPYQNLPDTQPRKGLKNEDKLKALLSQQIPESCVLGKAHDRGDCFFDALAQIINTINKTNINTDKYLRSLCHDFYTKNAALVNEWNEREYAGIDGRKDDYYMVQYTVDECNKHFNDRSPIWGRPNVEGRILCRALQLEAICVIEILEDPETRQPIPSFHLVTKDAYKSITDEDAQIWLKQSTIPALVVEQTSLHFVPLLNCDQSFRISLTQSAEYAQKQSQMNDNQKTNNPVQAAFFFRKAAKRKHTEATFELAQLYSSGQLGIKVRHIAINLFKLAAKKNHLGAIKELINIYTKGDLVNADAEKAAKWQARETMVLKR